MTYTLEIIIDLPIGFPINNIISLWPIHKPRGTEPCTQVQRQQRSKYIYLSGCKFALPNQVGECIEKSHTALTSDAWIRVTETRAPGKISSYKTGQGCVALPETGVHEGRRSVVHRNWTKVIERLVETRGTGHVHGSRWSKWTITDEQIA